MSRPYDDALRARLIEKAGELLSEQGPDGLSLRRVATAAGTSTTAVYSLFDGKPGLVRELYLEGFRRLGARMERVARTDDPVADLTALGQAYRTSALANRHFYSIMFGNAVPDFTPDHEARSLSLRSIRPLEDAVGRAVAQGAFPHATAGEIVFAAWGLVHGLVSLELSGATPPGIDREAAYGRALRTGLVGWGR